MPNKQMLFIKNGDDIEVGYERERDDKTKYFSTILIIQPLERCVMTDCGDPYMDYGISFDELSEIMEKIKALDKKGNV